MGSSHTTTTSSRVPFIASEHRKPSHTHLVLITTGSVASIKAPLIVSSLLSYQNVAVQVVTTKAALTFYRKEDVTSQGVNVWMDEDEWDVSGSVIEIAQALMKCIAKLQDRRPHITHRASSMGRHCPRCAMLSQHTRKDCWWNM
jgi:hypothetical protein